MIGMYLTQNKGKSVVAERFIKNLKNKIYKHMTAVSKHVLYDVLDDYIDICNNTYHNSIKIKLVDIKSGSHAEQDVDSNANNPKFKIGKHVKTSKYKNVFAKGYVPHWSEEVFVININKNTVSWTYVTIVINGEEIMKKNCKKTNQKEFRIERVIIKRKRNKLYVKWTGHDIHLIAGLINTILCKITQYFHKPYRNFGRDINVKVNLSNYATKTNLKNARVDTPNFALKSNLASLKVEIDKIDQKN